MAIENIRKEYYETQERLEIIKRENPDELDESWESEIRYYEGKIFGLEFALSEIES